MGYLVLLHLELIALSVGCVCMTTESAVAESSNVLPKALLNRRSYAPRLGLARALSRSADSHDQAHQLYQEVITMAPEVTYYYQLLYR